MVPSGKKQTDTHYHECIECYGAGCYAAGLGTALAGVCKTYFPIPAKGKNDHDDGEDALTGFVEVINGDVKGKKKARIGNKRRLGL